MEVEEEEGAVSPVPTEHPSFERNDKRWEGRGTPASLDPAKDEEDEEDAEEKSKEMVVGGRLREYFRSGLGRGDEWAS